MEKKTANCFEVNASVRLPASKCKNFALCHKAVKSNGLFCVKFQLSFCFYNFFKYFLVCKFYILWICLKQNVFLFLFYGKSLFIANSLCSNALISQALSNIKLQHCWSIIPETLWFDVLNFVCLPV